MTSTLTIRSPFDDSEIGEIPLLNESEVNQAVTLAASATKVHPLPAWRRAEILTACSDLIGERRDDLARTIAKESAKPITTALTEVARALSTVGFAGVEARRLGGNVLPMEGSMISEGKLAYTTRAPIGVVGAITPFNFPLNLVAHKVAPAIAAGCPVVLKPASQTPFSALALAGILYECGLPHEWLQVVTGSGSVVGETLIKHPEIKLISFTGSADVGWKIPAKAPQKKITLELGNSTPLIVEANSDWHAAVKAVASGGYNHAGQSCISVQRVYVQNDIAKDFTELLVETVKALEVGDPMNPDTNVSTLISDKDRDRVSAWIKEASAQGANIGCGGEIKDDILMPTVLTNTNLKMKVCSDEVFGPVVSLQQYDTLDRAIDLSNGTRYGLQAAIFTNDINDALRASKELEFAGVLINETPTWRADIMPYGGIKDSGNTREGPAYAVESMTEPRLTVVNLK